MNPLDDPRFGKLYVLAEEALTRGDSVEDMLTKLKQEGASPMESIKVLRGLLGIGLGEAKDVFHNSNAWADQKEAHEEAHERAIEALRQMDGTSS